MEKIEEEVSAVRDGLDAWAGRIQELENKLAALETYIDEHLRMLAHADELAHMSIEQHGIEIEIIRAQVFPGDNS